MSNAVSRPTPCVSTVSIREDMGQHTAFFSASHRIHRSVPPTCTSESICNSTIWLSKHFSYVSRLSTGELLFLYQFLEVLNSLEDVVNEVPSPTGTSLSHQTRDVILAFFLDLLCCQFRSIFKSAAASDPTLPVQTLELTIHSIPK